MYKINFRRSSDLVIHDNICIRISAGTLFTDGREHPVFFLQFTDHLIKSLR